MLAEHVTYDHVHEVARVIVEACVQAGIDPLELSQAPLDDGMTDNVVRPWVSTERDNMIALGTATPLTLKCLDFGLELCDAESLLCLVTMAVRGR